MADSPALATDSSGNYVSNSPPHYIQQRANPGTNKIEYNIVDITGYDGAIMFFYNYDGSAIDSLYLPKVASNLWTRYETYLTA